MNKIIYILLLLFTVSCGISEDCFKGNGSKTTLTFPYDNFTKIKVYSGVGLVVKEGPEYEVRIETRDNIKDNIEVTLNNEMLVVKDNSTCNIARDYGVTKVYVTVPNLEEIHSKTEQDIKSDGVLHFPELRLYSMGDGYGGTGAGTGDFYMDVECQKFYVETNSMSNFYINGSSVEAIIFFAWGDGRFIGTNFIIDYLEVFHRGSNDIISYPINSLVGTIFSTGNIVLKNRPIVVTVEEKFTGKIINEY